MDDSFDPYLQWLGIRDAQRPPNYYTLLGVAPLESDSDVISNAADRQMAHVRTFQTGKYSDVSQRLLNELAKAKVCLLNADKKADYDKKLSDKLAATQAAAAPVPAPTPAASAAPQIDVGSSDFAGVAAESGPSRPRSMADRAGRSSSKKSNMPLLIAAGLGLFGIGVIITVIVVVNFSRTDKDLNVKADTTEGGGKTVNPSNVGGATNPPQPDKTQNLVKIPDGPIKDPDHVKDPVAKDNPPAKWPFEPRQQAEPPAREAPPVKLSALVLKSLRAARRAMQDRDLDRADEQLEAAATAAKTTVEKNEVDRHREIKFMLRSYWDAVAAGLSKATVDETLKYRDGEVTIVSLGDGQVKLKAENGAEKSFDTDSKKIDLDVAHALAQDRLADMGPVGLAALGAAKAMDRQADMVRARELWKQALENGIPVSHFVPESRYDFSKLVANAIVLPPAGTRKPVPSRGDRAAAKKELNGLPYGDQIRQVKAAEQARALATRMLDQAENPENKDPLRYELFEAAIKQLVLAGALEEARGAVDELAKTFDVDRVERTAAVMISMVNIMADTRAAAALVEEMEKFAYHSAMMQKIDVADDLIGAAKAHARKLRSDAKRRLLTNHLARFTKFFGATKRLATNAEHAASHLVVGEFQCYIMGDWERGLKHLVKVADKRLSELARDDLAGPKDNEAQLALGDRWWEFRGKKQFKPPSQLRERVGVGQRSKHWYEASPGLGNDVNVETRKKNLKQLAEETEQLGIIPPEGLDLLATRLTVVNGEWGTLDGALVAKESAKGWPLIQFPVTPVRGRAYGLQIEFEKLPVDNWAGYIIVCLPTPGSHCAVLVNCADRTAAFTGIDYSGEGGLKRLGGREDFRAGKGKNTLIVTVEPINGGADVTIRARLNGKLIIDWTGPSATLKGAGSKHRVSNPQNVGVGVAINKGSQGMKIHQVRFQGPRAR